MSVANDATYTTYVYMKPDKLVVDVTMGGAFSLPGIGTVANISNVADVAAVSVTLHAILGKMRTAGLLET